MARVGYARNNYGKTGWRSAFLRSKFAGTGYRTGIAMLTLQWEPGKLLFDKADN